MSSRSTILVTGGSGFIGRSVVRCLDRRNRRDGEGVEGQALRMLVHTTAVPLTSSPANVTRCFADLADPRSLLGLCDGVDTVLHLASHISDDADTCWRVNARGTEALVEQARAAGVHRLVYVSSAAVYGWAVHRGATEDQVTVAPATPVSRSRVAAEQAVLGAGGIVLRPLFVYGDGDTRFIPAVLGALRRIPFFVDRGRAKISVVCVDDLAAVIVALAELPRSEWNRGAFHVTDGRPVEFRDVAGCLSQTFGLPLPRWSLPYTLARVALRTARGRATGPDVGKGSQSAAHRLFLVSRDHYYESSAIWGLTGLQPGLPLVARPELATWYGGSAAHRQVPAPRTPGKNERSTSTVGSA